MRKRFVEKSNYKAFWFDSGKTFRLPIDPTKEVLGLEHPEFYDIKIIDKCSGKCSWCYQNSTVNGDEYSDSYSKLHKFLSSIPKKDRPFQIAFGGGEPTEHKDFHDIMRLTKAFNIQPNFTTNGTWVERWSPEQIKYHLNTVKHFCGGVALSTHPHLEYYWRRAIDLYSEYGIRVNLHHIISDRNSMERMNVILEETHNKIDYMVLLPWISQGRAKEKIVDYDTVTELFPAKYRKQVAWGAHFYKYLTEEDPGRYVSLYPPEIFSKYLDLGGNGTLYSSSFSSEPIKENVI